VCLNSYCSPPQTNRAPGCRRDHVGGCPGARRTLG
jgi:hypothetical protein